MIIENMTTPNSTPLLGDTVRFYIGAKEHTEIWSVELGFKLMDLLREVDFDSLTKSEFRALFTLGEQVQIDNYFDNPALTTEQKQIIRTSVKSLEVADSVDLSSPTVAMFVNFLADVAIGAVPACNILTPARAQQVLSRGYVS